MNILFIDTVHPLLQQSLEAIGEQCTDGSKWTRAEILEKISAFHGVVIRSRIPLDKEFFDHAVNLRFVARAGAGMENIDVACAENNKVRCLNSPEGNRDAVGEQAIAMLLALFNNVPRADREVRTGIWRREENRGVELQGKTVGIIGYGNTGSVFAKKLSGFECRVLVYDKYKKGFSNNFVQEATMEKLFGETDILSLHIPLTENTRYLVNDSYIQQFRKNIYLINTSRGPCVKTSDLVENMKTGKVIGACLDVNEYEDVSFEKPSHDTEKRTETPWHWLLQSDRVILTPHIAGWTHESNTKMAQILYEKISKEIIEN
jgi:D-3-phosphoglycerate dehydrogenase